MTLAQKQRFTYEDYCKLPEQPRMELIEGEFLLSPAPNMHHQQISGEIGNKLYQWVRTHSLGAVFFAPCDVVLSDHHVIQPDILFVSKERMHIIHLENIRGAPDLVIEILSPGNSSRDRIVKKALYEKFGVREYWIIDPKLQNITVLGSKGKKFQVPETFSRGDVIESTEVRGFKVSVTDVFKVLLRRGR